MSLTVRDMQNWTIFDKAPDGHDIPWLNDPSAPHYPGIDWSHPTPFIQKMIERDRKNGIDIKKKFEEEAGDKKNKPKLLFAPDCIYNKGRYYLYFCGADDSEGVAVSDNPQGPFKDPVQLPCGGIDPASWNNHGSIEYFGGKWYVLYHRASGGVQQHRRLCMEKIEVLPDVTIPEVKMTSQGVGRPFVRGDVIMGYQACEVHGGCFVERDMSGSIYKEYIGNIAEGCSAVFRYISHSVEKPLYGLRIRGTGNGTIKIKLTCFTGNQLNAKPVRTVEAGEVSINDGKGTLEILDFEAGDYELTLKFIASENMNVEQIELY